jgi:hypothetical protein
MDTSNKRVILLAKEDMKMRRKRNSMHMKEGTPWVKEGKRIMHTIGEVMMKRGTDMIGRKRCTQGGTRQEMRCTWGGTKKGSGRKKQGGEIKPKSMGTTGTGRIHYGKGSGRMMGIGKEQMSCMDIKYEQMTRVGGLNEAIMQAVTMTTGRLVSMTGVMEEIKEGIMTVKEVVSGKRLQGQTEMKIEYGTNLGMTTWGEGGENTQRILEIVKGGADGRMIIEFVKNDGSMRIEIHGKKVVENMLWTDSRLWVKHATRNELGMEFERPGRLMLTAMDLLQNIRTTMCTQKEVGETEMKSTTQVLNMTRSTIC